MLLYQLKRKAFSLTVKPKKELKFFDGINNEMADQEFADPLISEYFESLCMEKTKMKKAPKNLKNQGLKAYERI